MAARNTRKQATRIAVIAFVAADCAGIAYVQHRMERKAAELQELAYAQPLAVPGTGAGALTFTPTAPALALATPRAAVPLAADAQPVAAAVTGASPKLTLAPAAAPARAQAYPLRALRIAPVAGLGATQLAITAPAAHRLHQAAPVLDTATAPGTGAFDNAFSLYDEAPDSEHRFGQEQAGATGGSNLADLVPQREEIAPLFDKAGIAPVTGEAAAVDLAAPAQPAADSTTDELPPTQG